MEICYPIQCQTIYYYQTGSPNYPTAKHNVVYTLLFYVLLLFHTYVRLCNLRGARSSQAVSGQ